MKTTLLEQQKIKYEINGILWKREILQHVIKMQ